MFAKQTKKMHTKNEYLEKTHKSQVKSLSVGKLLRAVIMIM